MKSHFKHILKTVSYILRETVCVDISISMHEHIYTNTNIFTWNWSEVHVFISGAMVVV